VVAELRPPLHHDEAVSPMERALDRLAREGKVRLGIANRPEAYPALRHQVRAGVVERLVDEDRGDT
jgi:hypothetical protein